MLWSVFVEGQTNHQFKPATFCPFAHIGVFIQGYGVWLSSAVTAWRDASFLSQTVVYSHASLSSSAMAPLEIKRMTGECKIFSIPLVLPAACQSSTALLN